MIELLIDDKDIIFLNKTEIIPMAYHPYGAIVAGLGVVSKQEGKREDSFSFATSYDGFGDAPLYVFTVDELKEYPKLLKSCIDSFLKDSDDKKEKELLIELREKYGWIIKRRMVRKRRRTLR